MSSSTLQTTNITASINSGEIVTDNNTTFPVSITDNVSIPQVSQGTGINQAQHLWQNTYTLNTSGTTLNLQSLAGGYDGASRNFGAVKSIKITNTDPTNSFVAGNAASNPWTGICSSGTALLGPIPPGGFMWFHLPSAAGAATGAGSLNLLIAAVSGTCAVQVTLFGNGT